MDIMCPTCNGVNSHEKWNDIVLKQYEFVTLIEEVIGKKRRKCTFICPDCDEHHHSSDLSIYKMSNIMINSSSYNYEDHNTWKIALQNSIDILEETIRVYDLDPNNTDIIPVRQVKSLLLLGNMLGMDLNTTIK